MTQTKGTGEAHPFLSPNDEFANSRSGTRAISTAAWRRRRTCSSTSTRSALKNGLKLEAQLGTNPFKFGMVGSSDAHTGLSAMEEENFFGKTAPQEPSLNG